MSRSSLRTLLAALLMSGLIACASKQDTHKPWYPHKPIAWRVTKGGHTRDAGPFASIPQYLSEIGLDQAVDERYRAFELAFPEFAGINIPIALNDDYVMWVPQVQSWAAGVQDPSGIAVCIWHRLESDIDPGDVWIKRPPGVYWGAYYAVWRFTGEDVLCPAIPHELLHACIGDPAHKLTQYWSRCP